jgi:ribosomal protein S18 acetylase RimI-like enzyme
MSAAPFRIELLGKQKRSTFDCGVAELNTYFHARVGQDVKRRYATCFVAVDKQNERIAGFYTLSMSSILLVDMPESAAKKLPRYPQVPVVRLGRLAVDVNYQGRKLGGSLLADAIARTTSSEIAAYAIVVEAKDNHAVAFYEHFGFLPLTQSPKTLFLPLSKAIKKLGKQ